MESGIIPTTCQSGKIHANMITRSIRMRQSTSPNQPIILNAPVKIIEKLLENGRDSGILNFFLEVRF
jgi:hypothetical protein